MKKASYAHDQLVWDHMQPAGRGSCVDKIHCLLVFCEIFAFFDLVGGASREDAGLFLALVGEVLVFGAVYGSTSPRLRFLLSELPSFMAFLFWS